MKVWINRQSSNDIMVILRQSFAALFLKQDIQQLAQIALKSLFNTTGGGCSISYSPITRILPGISLHGTAFA